MAKVADILTRLLEQTRQKKLNWKTTVDEQTFVAHFSNFSVMIALDRGIPSLRVLDKTGREIEVLYGESPSTSSSETTALEELHDEARRIALAVNSQLDELLKELESAD